MALRQIRTYPDPVLRTKCREIQAFDTELARLVSDMVETMHAAPGVGLAAPQVGIDIRVAVVDVSAGEEADGLLVLANPSIVESAGEETDFEGCLSIPEFSEKVKRPFRITVEAQGVDGEPFTFEAEEFLARVICHEVDHLDGVLFVDHLRGLKREKAKRHLRRLKRDAAVAT